MALFLDIGTVRPDVINDNHKYSIRSLNHKEWGKRDRAISQGPDFDKLHRDLQQNLFEGNTEALYGAIAKLYRNSFQDLLAKAKDNDRVKDTASFIKQNKDHDLIPEYRKCLATGDFQRCSEIQKEISRDNWREFLSSAKVTDLREVYRYFARIEGTGNSGGKPSRLDPLH